MREETLALKKTMPCTIYASCAEADGLTARQKLPNQNNHLIIVPEGKALKGYGANQVTVSQSGFLKVVFAAEAQVSNSIQSNGGMGAINLHSSAGIHGPRRSARLGDVKMNPIQLLYFQLKGGPKQRSTGQCVQCYTRGVHKGLEVKGRSHKSFLGNQASGEM